MSSNRIREKLLLVRVKEGDSEAFGEIYDTYVERIYRFVFFKVSSRAEAEDLTAEVFLKVLQYIQSARTVGNLNALLYRTARNLVIDHYRQRRRTDLSIEAGQEAGLPDIADERQGELLAQVQVGSDVERVRESLAKLKPEYREVILLRYLDELSIAEIAEILDRTKGAVRVLLHRALKVAREVVGDDAG